MSLGVWRHRNWPALAIGIYLAVLAAVTWQLGIGLVTSALVLSFVAVYVLSDVTIGAAERTPDAPRTRSVLRKRPFAEQRSFGTQDTPERTCYETPVQNPRRRPRTAFDFRYTKGHVAWIRPLLHP